MKAVVAVPPIRDFYFTPHRAAALGARVLIRELSELGWDVSLENFPLVGKPAAEELPDDLEYLRDFLISGETGPISWFTRYHRFGPDLFETVERILAGKPQIVFLSLFAWAYAEDACKLAVETARRMPDIPIVIGGHGPSALPEYFLKYRNPQFGDRPLFSLVVAGEIEGRGSLIRGAIKSGTTILDLRGASVRSELRPIAGASIPRGDRNLFSIILTRGCPRKCRFCSNHICHGREFRRSEYVLWQEEVIRVAGESTDFNLNIEDDNILFLKDEFFEFIESLKNRFPDITISAENGLDYLLLNDSDLIRLKNFGFKRLNLSLGILSGELSRGEKRDGDPEKLAEVIHLASDLGLDTTTHVISGLSADSPEKAIEALLFLDRLPTTIGISSFYPVPGLPGFTDTGRFLKRVPRLALGSSIYPWTGSLSTRQMLTVFRLARWSNFRKRIKSGISVTPEGTELYEKITRTGRLHTVIRENHRRRIIEIPNLDIKMTNGFLSCPLSAS